MTEKTSDDVTHETALTEQLTLFRTDADTIVFHLENHPSPATVTLTQAQATKIQKLLSMPGDPLPTYRGRQEFFLAGDVPSGSDASAYPRIASEEGEVQLTGRTGDSLSIPSTALPDLQQVLSEWGFSLGGEDAPYSVLTLPAMIALEDGITEPLLHAEYDEVLEHYHRAVGYWSPSNEEYVTQH